MRGREITLKTHLEFCFSKFILEVLLRTFAIKF